MRLVSVQGWGGGGYRGLGESKLKITEMVLIAVGVDISGLVTLRLFKVKLTRHPFWV